MASGRRVRFGTRPPYTRDLVAYPQQNSTPGHQIESHGLKKNAARRHLELPGSFSTNEGSIYNAAPTGSETEVVLGDNGETRVSDALQGAFAGNIALFIPLPSPPDSPHSTWLNRQWEATTEEGIASSTVCHSQMISHTAYTNGRQTLSTCSVLKFEDSKDPVHRKAVSLNDAENSLRVRHWPGNLISPVNPILPKYPPPVRAPTPPGLPSFGTREAVSYAAQFTMPSSSVPGQRHSHQSGRRGSSRCANNSEWTCYSDIFRRFLGLTPSPASEPAERRPLAIGRAEDGTAVQGRFPYRQSGHGMSLARRLDDHPFHLESLSLSPCEEAVSGTSQTAATTRRSNRLEVSSKDEQPMPTGPLRLSRQSRVRHVLLHTSRGMAARQAVPPPAELSLPTNTSPVCSRDVSPQSRILHLQPTPPSRASDVRSFLNLLDITGETPGRYPSAVESSLPDIQPQTVASDESFRINQSFQLWDRFLKIFQDVICCWAPENDDDDDDDMETPETDGVNGADAEEVVSRETFATARSALTNEPSHQ
ncbi:hypothetical protein ASPZODRAFT_140343 [Penicilliopsis zonata CBS 506.65]|uniref:Uncharacterized protein n=1 Tax=Penicilliopsis zonata CBS 506.65 TaxID=1073090 RepID=A0A1L9SQD7_9EURO|nr:hypothetical protein ASPZODRAFT_140343 [Penicilliopsis zonata CBS 506.65]OJJ49445.1 hypothetical protein ASPZODRAFT_140343 [Penicilliopsis zonata CBS 506.65]